MAKPGMRNTHKLAFGRTVPDDAVNIAYISVPQIIPEENVQIINVATAVSFDTLTTGTSGVGRGEVSISVSGNVEVIPSTLVTADDTTTGVEKGIRVEGCTSSITNRWGISISNGLHVRTGFELTSSEPSGSWLRQIGLSEGETLNLYYTIPEYLKQPFEMSTDFIGRHVIKLTDESAQVIGANDFKLANLPIVAVEKITINGESILSTKTSVESGAVTGLDLENGIITLNRALSFEDDIKVDYYYREDSYNFYGYLDNSVWQELDLNPESGHFYTESSVAHPSTELLDKVVLVYVLPSAATKDSEYFAPPSDFSSFVRFKTFDLTDPVVANNFGSSLYGYPSALVIARIYVTSNSTEESIVTFDTRSRGGGIFEGLEDTFTATSDIEIVNGDVYESIAPYSELLTYYDVGTWDGVPTYLAGVAVIDLDESLRTRFGEAYIRATIAKYAPAGTKFFIRWKSE